MKSTLPAETGAPNALRAIEQEEALARAFRDDCLAVYKTACKDAIDKPREKDGTDWDLMESVAKRHWEDAETALDKKRKLLLSFDKAVAPEKRDSTEKITQQEGERLLTMFWIYEGQATESLCNLFSREVLEKTKPEEVYELFRVKLIETKANAMKLAIGEAHLPPWVGRALEGVL